MLAPAENIRRWRIRPPKANRMEARELFGEKIKTLDELKRIVGAAKAAGKKVVLANGCFDLLHVGHIRYLRGAKERGDILVVGINSDASVRALKGKGRPYIPEQERMMFIAAVECVDYVTLFDAVRVDDLLIELKPDFHAKGTDYTKDTVPEKDIVASFGGKVIITGDPKEHSSTDIIAKIRGKQRT
jgi:D-glycero-beta-D-manno-heptose 1-phosphate adenylyltransferase